ADDGTRTRDPHLGKVMLYQLSHVRVGDTTLAMPPGGPQPADGLSYDEASARSTSALADGENRRPLAASRPAGLIFLAVFCRISTVFSCPFFPPPPLKR